MSTADPVAVRAIALAEAVKYLGGKGDPIASAELFLDFLNGAESQPAATTTKTKAATTAQKAEPKKPAGPTREEVDAKVQELLGANKRKEAAALMNKYGAKNVSTLPVDKYAEFLEGADAILVTA